MSTLKFRTIFHHLTFYFGWISPSSCSAYPKLSKWYQSIRCILPIWVVRLLAKVVNLLMPKLRAKFTAYFSNPSNLLTSRIFTSLYMWWSEISCLAGNYGSWIWWKMVKRILLYLKKLLCYILNILEDTIGCSRNRQRVSTCASFLCYLFQWNEPYKKWRIERAHSPSISESKFL